jgi:hypothetical protein
VFGTGTLWCEAARGAKRLDELPGRDDGDVLPETRGEVPEVPGDEEVRMRGEGDLEKGVVVGIGESFRERLRDDELAGGLDLKQERFDHLRIKPEPAAREDFTIFTKDPFLEKKGERARGDEPDDLPWRAEGGPEPRHQYVCVEDDPHRSGRFRRTSAMIALICLSERFFPRRWESC